MFYSPILLYRGQRDIALRLTTVTFSILYRLMTYDSTLFDSHLKGLAMLHIDYLSLFCYLFQKLKIVQE